MQIQEAHYNREFGKKNIDEARWRVLSEKMKKGTYNSGVCPKYNYKYIGKKHIGREGDCPSVGGCVKCVNSPSSDWRL